MSASPVQHDRVTGYLAQHDFECPLCEYNLRGVGAARCPECGREVTEADIKVSRRTHLNYARQYQRIGLVVGWILTVTFLVDVYRTMNSSEAGNVMQSRGLLALAIAGWSAPLGWIVLRRRQETTAAAERRAWVGAAIAWSLAVGALAAFTVP